MTTHIALLRAVNVGGTGKVAMADLRAFFEALGFENVRTLIQTGNVVFAGGARDGARLEAFLERKARGRLGLDTSFLIRTPREWDAMIAANPFAAEAGEDGRRVVAMALKDAPEAERAAALQAVISGPERVRAGGRHLYIDYPGGQGNSKLTGALIEKTLGTRGTARNWNTVLRLAGMAGE